jgi:ABC-type lipoprotein release transport system permease subunit
LRRIAELVLLALSSLRRTPLRISLTSLGVAIATGALVSMVGFALGIQAQVEEPFQKMELVNRIDVRPKRPSESTLDNRKSPDPAGQALDDEAVAQLASLPGVLLAYPEIHLDSVQVAYQDRSQTGPAVGLPPEAVRLRFVTDALVGGRFFGPSADQEIVLGRKLAQGLGFDAPEDAVGRTVQLHVKGLTPVADGKFHYEKRQLQLLVVGVWNPPNGRHGYAAEGCILPLALMKDLPGTRAEAVLGGLWHSRTEAGTGYGRVVVRVARPSDLFAVEKRIQDMGFETQMLLGQASTKR